MSVSVFNPMQLTEFHRMKFPDAKMHHAQRMKPSLDRVRRDLFGPVDREESNRWVDIYFIYFPTFFCWNGNHFFKSRNEEKKFLDNNTVHVTEIN